MTISGSIRPGSGYGFADQTVGVNYRLLESRSKSQPSHSPPIFLDIQVQGDLPAYNTATSEASQTPYPGDGSTDITAGLIGGVPIVVNKSDSISAQAGAGYTYRSNSFSAAIPWMGTVIYSPYKEGLTASASFIGLTSLLTDPNASGALRSNAGAGGSFYIGGTNPSLMTIRASVGYKFEENTEMTLYGAQSIWGQATPQGFTLALGFQTRFGGSNSKNPVHMTPSSYGHSNKGFLNYSLEAKVMKSNDRMNLVKIDKGSQDGVEVGQFFDIFSVRRDGIEEGAIARGQVTNVVQDAAALDITEYYKEVWIDEGFVARRVIQSPQQ